MLNTTLTPEFKNFLFVLERGIKLHQKIGIFYDMLYISDLNICEMISSEFSAIFKDFYNVIFFSDYIGGFLTNKEGNIFRNFKPYSFIIFLNFDYLNVRHCSFLNELRSAKIEYIIISSNSIDVLSYTPFLFLHLDLNKLNILKIFQLYLSTYLKQNLKIIGKKNNQYSSLLLNKNKSKLYYLISLSIFLISLLKKKQILYYQLNFGFFCFIKKTVTKISFKTFLKILLAPTLFRKEFIFTILRDKNYSNTVENLKNLSYIKIILRKKLKKLYFKLHEKKFDLKKVCFS